MVWIFSKTGCNNGAGGACPYYYGVIFHLIYLMRTCTDLQSHHFVKLVNCSRRIFDGESLMTSSNKSPFMNLNSCMLCRHLLSMPHR